MALKKFKADQLFDGTNLSHDDLVLILSEDGVVEDIVGTNQAGDDILKVDGILCPGFINCHCHLELSHMKGLIPEGTGLTDFVISVVNDRHTSEELILQAIEKAEDEMLANGIVATGDICNNALSIAQKAKGRMYYHNFIEATGYVPDAVNDRFERSKDIFSQYAAYYSIPIDSNSIVPHAAYSVAGELWDKIIYFPGNHLLTIHNQETAAENEWFTSKTGELAELYKRLNIDVSFFKPSGKTSFQTYFPRFLRNQQVILVHNLYTAQEDLTFSHLTSHDSRLFWCLCPNANQYISRTLPDVKLLIENNCDIVLGTDSLASNHQLSILSEMKIIHSRFPEAGIGKLLQWATLNGARALQMETLLGSFEKGKRPGVLQLNAELTSVKRLT